MTRSEALRLAAAGLAGCALAACGGDDADEAAARKTTKPPPAPLVCPAGQTEIAVGQCMSVGPQGCAEALLGDDGLCHPTVKACPGGTVPRFEEGCVPVGVSPCAAELVGEDGFCHPRASACPDGTFPVPSLGCVPIDGDGCGDAPWGDAPEGPENLYVDPSAPAGGTGEEASPFQTLAEALDAAGDGSRVVLAAGTYDEPVKLVDAVEIRGRCPSLVSIQGVQETPYGSDAVLWIEGADGASIRGVTIGGGKGVGVLLHGGAVTLEGVHVGGAKKYALLVGGSGSDITLTRCLVDGTLAEGGKRGEGLDVEQHASARVVQSAFVDNRDLGVTVLEDSELTMEDSVVEGTQPQDGSQSFGYGLFVQGGTVTVRGSAFVGNRSAGVRVLKGGTLDMSGSLVEGTLERTSNGDYGHGLELTDGTTATVTGSAILGNLRAGVLIGGDGTEVSLDGDYVAGTLPTAKDDELGMGVAVLQGATATIANAVIADNHDLGLFVNEASADVTGTLIEGTLPQHSDGLFGRGVDLQAGELTFTGSVVRGSYDTGFWLGGAGTTASLSGSIVEATQPKAADGENGAGVVCVDGASLTMAQSLVADSRVSGVRATAATASIQGSVVRDVPEGVFTVLNPSQTYEGVGDGILAMLGSTVDVTDTLVEGCVRAGLLFASSKGTVRRTRSRDNGYGIVVQGEPAPIVGEESSFEGNAEGGVVEDGELPVPDAASDVPVAL